MTGQSARWVAARDEDCLWAHWDEGYVLYHRPSGLTHLVNDPTEQLLRRVLREPRTFPEILEAMNGPAADAASARAIGAGYGEIVERLRQLGLVRRLSA